MGNDQGLEDNEDADDSILVLDSDNESPTNGTPLERYGPGNSEPINCSTDSSLDEDELDDPIIIDFPQKDAQENHGVPLETSGTNAFDPMNVPVSNTFHQDEKICKPQIVELVDYRKHPSFYQNSKIIQDALKRETAIDNHHNILSSPVVEERWKQLNEVTINRITKMDKFDSVKLKYSNSDCEWQIFPKNKISPKHATTANTEKDELIILMKREENRKFDAKRNKGFVGMKVKRSTPPPTIKSKQCKNEQNIIILGSKLMKEHNAPHNKDSAQLKENRSLKSVYVSKKDKTFVGIQDDFHDLNLKLASIDRNRDTIISESSLIPVYSVDINVNLKMQHCSPYQNGITCNKLKNVCENGEFTNNTSNLDSKNSITLVCNNQQQSYNVPVIANVEQKVKQEAVVSNSPNRNTIKKDNTFDSDKFRNTEFKRKRKNKKPHTKYDTVNQDNVKGINFTECSELHALLAQHITNPCNSERPRNKKGKKKNKDKSKSQNMKNHKSKNKRSKTPDISTIIKEENMSLDHYTTNPLIDNADRRKCKNITRNENESTNTHLEIKEFKRESPLKVIDETKLESKRSSDTNINGENEDKNKPQITGKIYNESFFSKLSNASENVERVNIKDIATKKICNIENTHENNQNSDEHITILHNDSMLYSRENVISSSKEIQTSSKLGSEIKRKSKKSKPCRLESQGDSNKQSLSTLKTKHKIEKKSNDKKSLSGIRYDGVSNIHNTWSDYVAEVASMVKKISKRTGNKRDMILKPQEEQQEEQHLLELQSRGYSKDYQPIINDTVPQKTLQSKAQSENNKVYYNNYYLSSDNLENNTNLKAKKDKSGHFVEKNNNCTIDKNTIHQAPNNNVTQVCNNKQIYLKKKQDAYKTAHLNAKENNFKCISLRDISENGGSPDFTLAKSMDLKAKEALAIESTPYPANKIINIENASVNSSKKSTKKISNNYQMPHIPETSYPYYYYTSLHRETDTFKESVFCNDTQLETLKEKNEESTNEATKEQNIKSIQLPADKDKYKMVLEFSKFLAQIKPTAYPMPAKTLNKTMTEYTATIPNKEIATSLSTSNSKSKLHKDSNVFSNLVNKSMSAKSKKETQRTVNVNTITTENTVKQKFNKNISLSEPSPSKSLNTIVDKLKLSQLKRGNFCTNECIDPSSSGNWRPSSRFTHNDTQVSHSTKVFGIISLVDDAQNTSKPLPRQTKNHSARNKPVSRKQKSYNSNSPYAGYTTQKADSEVVNSNHSSYFSNVMQFPSYYPSDFYLPTNYPSNNVLKNYIPAKVHEQLQCSVSTGSLSTSILPPPPPPPAHSISFARSPTCSFTTDSPLRYQPLTSTTTYPPPLSATNPPPPFPGSYSTHHPLGASSYNLLETLSPSLLPTSVTLPVRPSLPPHSTAVARPLPTSYLPSPVFPPSNTPVPAFAHSHHAAPPPSLATQPPVLPPPPPAVPQRPVLEESRQNSPLEAIVNLLISQKSSALADSSRKVVSGNVGVNKNKSNLTKDNERTIREPTMSTTLLNNKEISYNIPMDTIKDQMNYEKISQYLRYRERSSNSIKTKNIIFGEYSRVKTNNRHGSRKEKNGKKRKLPKIEEGDSTPAAVPKKISLSEYMKRFNK